MDTPLGRASRGIAYALAGAYVGAVLFFVTLGVSDTINDPQKAKLLWWEDLSTLFTMCFYGIILLSWWIVPVGAFFGLYADSKLSKWPRNAAVVRGILLGLVLGFFTAVAFDLVSGHPSMSDRTVRAAFAFLPVYCAVWCGGYAWLRVKRTPVS